VKNINNIGCFYTSSIHDDHDRCFNPLATLLTISVLFNPVLVSRSARTRMICSEPEPFIFSLGAGAL